MQSRFETIVIGGGQAGFSVGYFLARQGRDYLILDDRERIGDAWRQRWDSLRLFTSARFDGLAGMPFPAPGSTFPTKDEMADYLESYARRFDLNVRLGTRVDGLTREGSRFVITAGDRRFEADNVVVAMADLQRPRIPAFAGELAPGIVQMHSADYRNPTQLQPGGVLIVGAGNSGAEIALDVARQHPTWLSGRDVGQIPFRIDSPAAHLVVAPLLFRVVFHRLLTVDTPMGRRAQANALAHGLTLIRIKRRDLDAAGIERVLRTTGVREGLPVLADGRVMDVANVIWSTGFELGFDWIKLPLLGERQPRHYRGVVASQPGLYFVGLHFLSAQSSAMVHGVGRDAEYIANRIVARAKAPAEAPAVQAQQPSAPPKRPEPAAVREETAGREQA